MISKLILGAGCFWGVEVLFEEATAKAYIPYCPF